jgi:hypothetical protein
MYIEARRWRFAIMKLIKIVFASNTLCDITICGPSQYERHTVVRIVRTAFLLEGKTMSLAVRGGMTAPVSSSTSTADVFGGMIYELSQLVLNHFYAGTIRRMESEIARLTIRRDRLRSTGKLRTASKMQTRILREERALTRVRRQVT